MSDTTLGHLLDNSAERDAIHIAIAPVRAAQILRPGEHVGFIDDDCERVGRVLYPLGIVDPFLKEPVLPGQRFYLCLYQQTVTGMRHHWTHPAFVSSLPPKEQPYDAKAASEQWLRDLAEELDIGYRALLDAAKLWIDELEYTVQHGSDHWRSAFSGREEKFWMHYEVVTGAKVDDHSAHFFSCSC